MCKNKKIILILIVCFLCMLIPNKALAATWVWKGARKFTLPEGKCTNSEHPEGCKTYKSGNRVIHVGNTGFSKGSPRIILNRDMGVLCLQHNNQSEDEFGEVNLSIQYKMAIDENTVTIKPLSKEAREDSGKDLIKLENSEYSARVAYILSHISDNINASANDRYENGTQGALWEIVPSFWKELKQKTAFEDGSGSETYNSWIKKGKKITDESIAYGNFAKSNSSAPSTIKTTIMTKECPNNSSYYLVGPFKMKYADNTYTDSENQIIRFAGYDTSSLKMDNNSISSSDWSLCNSKGKEINKPSNTGEAFYIKVKKNKMSGEGSLKVNVKRMKVRAEYFTMVSATGKQENAIVTLAERYYVTESVTFKFGKTGNLRIVKTDADTTSKKLAGVKFKIKNSNGYIKIIDNNNKTQTSVTGVVNVKSVNYVDKIADGTEFVTNTSGIIEIHNILADSYTIQETSIGNNYGYQISDNTIWKIGSKETTGKYGIVNVGSQSKDNVGVSDTIVNSSYVNIVTVKNQKQTGNLRIVKVDADNPSKKLSGVRFKIKSEKGYIRLINSKGNEQSRATGIGNISDIKYVGKNDATEFVTNADGIVEIHNILVGSYTIEESSVGNNYGYIIGTERTVTVTRQTSINANISSKIKDDTVVKIVTIKNQKQTGNLRLIKVDKDNKNKKLQGVRFKIKDSNGYIRITNSAGNEQSLVNGVGNISKIRHVAKSSATEFMTNEDGIVEIHNILVGTYTIEESSVGTNYGYKIVGNKTVTVTRRSSVNVTVSTTLKDDNLVNRLTIENEKQLGNLRIVKTDADDSKIKLQGVKFKIKGSSGYIKITDNNNKELSTVTGIVNIKSIKYVTQITEATEFVTNENGIIEIHNILVDSYIVRETGVGANYGYRLSDNNTTWVVGKNEVKGKIVTVTVKKQELDNVKVSDTVVESKYATIVTAKNKKRVGDLKLQKVDDRNTNKKLANVEFVIKSSLKDNQYIKVRAIGDNVKSNTKGFATRIVGEATVTRITYVDKKENATKFVTDSEGILSVKDLIATGSEDSEIKYNIIEYKNPNKLYNADYTSGYVSLSSKTIQATNHQVYIYLEGYAWEDIASSKDNSRDDVYTNTDALIQGINVSLYEGDKKIKTIKTDQNGKYRFENVEIDKLSKYHVQFEYDGLRFVTVAVNRDYSGDKYKISSKAVEVASGREDKKDRENINADFSEIANGKSRNNGKEVYTLNYDFKDHISTYQDHWEYEYNKTKTKLKVTPSSDYAIIASTKYAETMYSLKEAYEKQNDSEILTGINLGIRRREKFDLAISTDIRKLDVVVRGYKNTYTYGNRKEYENQNPNGTNYNVEEDGFGVDVKFGSKYSTSYSNKGLKTYTRRIYESDLAVFNRNYEKNQDLMRIYVTYKITIKNQSNKLRASVNELVDYYDSRYTIEKSWIMNGNKRTDIDANEWSEKSKYGTSYNENGYKAIYTQAASDIVITHRTEKSIYTLNLDYNQKL